MYVKGELYVWYGGNWTQVTGGGGGGGASQLSDLSDVGPTSYTAAHVLRANGTTYIEALLGIEDLSDVYSSMSESDGDVLTWDDGNSRWDAAAAAGGVVIGKTVCASDCCDCSGCDYTCDGTDDQVQINAALTAIDNAGGGPVWLSDGTFNISDSCNIGDDTTLKGDCWFTVLEMSAGGSHALVTNEDHVGGNHGIILDSFKLVGENTSDNGEFGVFFNEVDNAVITRLWAENFYSGIECRDSSEIVVTLCKLDSNFSGFRAVDTVDSQLTGNFLTNNQYGGYFVSSSRCALAGNTVMDNPQFGLYFGSGEQNSIARNVLKGNGAAGSFFFPGSLFMMGCPNSEITDNMILDCYQNGILLGSVLMGDCDNVVIANNIFDQWGSGYDGITLIGDYCSVIGNEFTTAGTGQYCISTSGNSDLTMIHGNNFYSGASSGEVEDSGTNTRIRDNIAIDGTWLADNKDVSYEPTKGYELSASGSKFHFATHYYDVETTGEAMLNEAFDHTLAMYWINSKTLRFVIYDYGKEWPSICKMLEAAKLEPNEGNLMKYVHPSEPSWAAANLKVNFDSLESRCVTRSMAAYYLENLDEFPWTTQDIMDYLDDMIGIIP